MRLVCCSGCLGEYSNRFGRHSLSTWNKNISGRTWAQILIIVARQIFNESSHWIIVIALHCIALCTVHGVHTTETIRTKYCGRWMCVSIRLVVDQQRKKNQPTKCNVQDTHQAAIESRFNGKIARNYLYLDYFVRQVDAIWCGIFGVHNLSAHIGMHSHDWITCSESAVCDCG